jgi:hypothetical protein
MSKAGVDRHNVSSELSDSMNVSSRISVFQVKDMLVFFYCLAHCQ